MSDLAQAARTNPQLSGRGAAGLAVRARKAAPADAGELSRLLAAAFYDDPIFGWCFPNPSSRRAILPGVFRIFVDAYRDLDETYTTEAHLAGAVCAPPEAEPDEGELAGLEEVAGGDAPRVQQLSELLSAGHPGTPHYYLLFLATQPQRQSQGIGSTVLGQLLGRWDRDGMPAYLDATSERNRRLYLRHGFEVTDEVRLPGGPPFWRMWRGPAG